MTARDDLDRLLSAWFDGDAPTHEPEHLLGQVLARTAHTSRRPAWRSTERFHTMQATMRIPTAPRGMVLLPIVLLVAMLAVALIAVGSQRRMPPPFGLAKAGLLAYENNGDIVLANVDGSGQIVLVSGPTYGASPTWSRDGSRLAYWSALDWDKPATLVVVGADGRDPSEVIRGVIAPSTRISWSPDGRRIAFSAQVGAVDRLMIADIGRTGATPIGDATLQGKNPVWSPDGRTLAFTGGSTYKDAAIYLVGDDGSGLRRLTTVADTVELGEYDWSPDGRFVLFTAGSFSNHDVWVVSADGSDEHRIAATPADEYAPRWSPDGRRIAFTRVAGTDDPSGKAIKTPSVYVANVDGSDPTVIETDAATGFWAPDGERLILWSADPAGNWRPTLVDKTGKRTGQQLVDGDPMSWQRLAP